MNKLVKLNNQQFFRIQIQISFIVRDAWNTKIFHKRICHLLLINCADLVLSFLYFPAHFSYHSTDSIFLNV